MKRLSEIFAPTNWPGNFLGSTGQSIAAIAAVVAVIFVWVQVRAFRDDLDKRYFAENNPHLTFTESPRIEVVTRNDNQVVRLIIPLVNQGSGVATRLDVKYAESLQLPAHDSHIRRTADLSEDEIKKHILSEYNDASQAFTAQSEYVAEPPVTRENASVAAGGTYDVVYQRPLKLPSDGTEGVNADLFCVAFYETSSGGRRMSSIWYRIEVDNRGHPTITPLHVGFVSGQARPPA